MSRRLSNLRRAALYGLLVLGLLAPCGRNESSGITATDIFAVGEMPRGFPSDFPLPDDARVIHAQGGSGSSLAFFSSSRSPSNLYRLLVTRLARDNWELLTCTSFMASRDQVVAITATRGDDVATVSIGEIPGIHYSVTEPYSFYVWIVTSSGPVPDVPEKDRNCDPMSVPSPRRR